MTIIDLTIIDLTIIDLTIIDLTIIDLTIIDLTIIDLTIIDLTIIDLTIIDLTIIDLTIIDLTIIDLTIIDLTIIDLTIIDLTIIDLTIIDLTCDLTLHLDRRLGLERSATRDSTRLESMRLSDESGSEFWHSSAHCSMLVSRQRLRILNLWFRSNTILIGSFIPVCNFVVSQDFFKRTAQMYNHYTA